MKSQAVVLWTMVALFAATTAVAEVGNCTQVDGSTRPDCPKALAFFHTLQSALRENDRLAIATLVAYPVLTSLNHKHVRIKNRAQLMAHFDEIFDKGVRCTILNATEKDVWGNWQGFTVDGGPVWFDGIIPRGQPPDAKAPDYWKKYPFKVVTINNESKYPCSP